MTEAAQVVDLVRSLLGGKTARVPARVVDRERSTLYFFSIDGKHLVAKVRHSDPAERCRREYDALVEIERRFAAYNDPRLRAVRPVAFLEPLNAIVMERVEGRPLYDAAMPLVRLTTSGGRARATELMRLTGRWLRVLHGAEPARLDPLATVGRNRALAGLAEERARLDELGVALDRAAVRHSLDTLSSDGGTQNVWLHSDFHLRNVHVVQGGGVVGLDTSFKWKGNPYADLGKFLADMKTRRARVLRRGWLPSNSLLEQFERALLCGYDDGREPGDLRQLRLFEGWFLLRKWRRIAEELRAASGTRGLIGAAARSVVIDPAYAAAVQRWCADVRASNGRPSGRED